MLTILKNRNDFVNLTKNGDKWVCRSFVVLTLPQSSTSDTSQPPAWGFTASKKIGNAVKRNRAKRRMRALAQKMNTHPYARDKQIVLIARESVLTQPFAVLEKDLNWAFRKLNERHQNQKKGAAS